MIYLYNGGEFAPVPQWAQCNTSHYLMYQEESRAGRITTQPSVGFKSDSVPQDWSYDFNMADTGPLLTSCIIFYLSIGAAIFQILEEPNWESARDEYMLQKEKILKDHACLTRESLDKILEVWIHRFLMVWREKHDCYKLSI